MVRIFLIIIVTMLVCPSYGQSRYLRTTIKDQLSDFQKKGYVFNYDASILQSDIVYVPNYASHQELISFLDASTKYNFEKVDDKSFIIRSRRSGSSMNTQLILTQLEDENLGVPLPYVEVRSDVFGLVGVSDSMGMLSMKMTILPGDSLSMSAIGYELTKIATQHLSTNKTIKLRPSNQTLVELIVTDRNSAKQGFISHIIHMDRVPSIGGSAEKDPLALAQMMPGLSGLSESVSNISIRSSTADHNLIQWNDIPIYHTGHYLGLMSSINPHIVDQIDVYTDGFNSRFGNRVAGVIDMKAQNHHSTKLKVHLHSNLLSTNLHLLVPIIPNKLSIQFAARTSYDDKFKNITYNRFFDQSFQIGKVNDIRNIVAQPGKNEEYFPITNVSFYDMNAHLLWTPSTKDELRISYVKARDLVRNELTFVWSENVEVDTVKLASYGWNVKYSRKLTEKIRWSTLITKSGFDNFYSAHDNVKDIANSNFTIKKTTVDETHFQSFITKNGKKSILDIGLEYRMIDNRVLRFFKPVNMYEPNLDKTKNGSLASLFLHYAYKPISNFEIEFGTRMSRYNLNEKMYVEPRIAASQKLNNWLTAKVSLGQYTQVLSQIEDFNNLQVEDLHWRLTDGQSRNDLIPIVQNTQFSASFTAKGKNIEATVTGYKKNVESITALGLEFDYGAHPYNIGKAIGQGIEFLTKYSSKWGQSMISYTYSDMMLDFDWDRMYPAPYNHRHNINVAHSFTYRGLDLTLVGRWKTGRPYSEYTSFLVIDEPTGPKPEFTYDNGVYNLYLPNYLRFDANAAYKIKFKNDKTFMRFGVSVINLFDRTNIVHRVNFVDYSYWPEIRPNTFDRLGLGLTPNVFFEMGF